MPFGIFLKQRSYAGFDFLHVGCRFEAGNDISFPVDDELGEVPFDIGLLVPIRIGLRKHLFEQFLVGVLIETFETFLSL